jgi:hypothetical protein
MIILVADAILSVILSIVLRCIKKSTNKMIDDFVIEQRKRDGLQEVKYEAN